MGATQLREQSVAYAFSKFNWLLRGWGRLTGRQIELHVRIATDFVLTIHTIIRFDLIAHDFSRQDSGKLTNILVVRLHGLHITPTLRRNTVFGAFELSHEVTE